MKNTFNLSTGKRSCRRIEQLLRVSSLARIPLVSRQDPAASLLSHLLSHCIYGSWLLVACIHMNVGKQILVLLLPLQVQLLQLGHAIHVLPCPHIESFPLPLQFRGHNDIQLISPGTATVLLQQHHCVLHYTVRPFLNAKTMQN